MYIGYVIPPYHLCCASAAVGSLEYTQLDPLSTGSGALGWDDMESLPDDEYGISEI
jgi:hypothetical protein